MDSTVGRLVVIFFAGLAQFEADMIGERTCVPVYLGPCPPCLNSERANSRLARRKRLTPLSWT